MITRHSTLWCEADIPSPLGPEHGPTIRCPEWADVAGDDARELRRNARSYGWTRKASKDYCPKHRDGGAA